MKKTSNLFYSIGFVLNIIGIVFYAVLIAIFAIAMNNAEAISKIATDTGSTVEYVRQSLLALVILISVSIVIDIVVSVFVLRAKRNLREGNGRTGTHILLLVLGILSINLFYLLGGIFGVVAAGDDNSVDE